MLEFLSGASSWAWRSGELAFARGWPLWPLFALLTLALVAVTASFVRGRQLDLMRTLALGALQFAFIAIVLIALWRPVLNVEHIRDRQNVVAVLVDNSRSMDTADAVQGQGQPEPRSRQAMAALQGGVLSRIAASSDVRLFAFSDRADAIESLDGLSTGAPQTRIGEAMNSVLQMASSVPLAAVVLVSDGAETGGTLDEASLARLKATGVPVHTVGVGAEQFDNDLELEQLTMPGSAIAGEMLQAQVSIRHQRQGSTRIRVYDGAQLIAARELKLNPEGPLTTASIEIPAGAAGARDLRAVLDTAPGETNEINNSRRQVVEVSGRRRHVLYIEGEPRWEYKFIRRAVEEDRTLRLVSVMRASPNRYYRQGVSSAAELQDGFPATAAELFAFDAVIIGSLEAAALSAEQQGWLKDFVDRRGGSLMLLAGRDGLGDGGWGRSPVAQVLPAALPGGAASYSARISTVRPTGYGLTSALGRFDADPARNAKAWQELPPLADFQALGRLKPGAIVLLDAVAGKQAEPLLVTQRYGRGAAWMLATATTWRWQMRLPLEDRRHEQFWQRLLHGLTAPAPQPVSLRAERTVQADDANMVLEAELLDEEFRPLEGAAIEVRAVAEDGAVAPVTVEPSGRGDGRYTLQVQASAPGMYRVEMAAQKDGKEVAQLATHVRREDGVREYFGAWQHRAALERIARDTGGRYWTPAALGELPEAIRYSRAGMVERQMIDLWNIPLVFLLLAMLKSGEWLLRRHWRHL